MRFAIAIIAAFALLLAGCASSPPASTLPAGTPPASATPPASVPPATPSASQPAAQTLPPVAPGDGILPEHLAVHNTVDDCWVGYKGSIYDISMFIPNHKNYEALLVPLCGTSGDFEKKFEGKHGMSKVSVLESQPLMGRLAQ